jgi:hypothetical protein
MMPKGCSTRSVASLGERTRPAAGLGSCLIANGGEDRSAVRTDALPAFAERYYTRADRIGRGPIAR